MYIVNPSSEVVVDMRASVSPFDLEALFRSQYGRVARIIARVVRDPARAEDLAVEVFLKLWRNPKAGGEKVEGWLYRVALRAGLDELRRQTRRARYEGLLGLVRAKRAPVTPEELHLATEEQDRVRFVLSIIEPRQAAFLLLRSQGFSYDEVASTLNLNPASVGTLLSRAQQAFRKEYIKRYGQE